MAGSWVWSVEGLWLVLLIEFWLFPQQFIAECFSDRGFNLGQSTICTYTSP